MKRPTLSFACRHAAFALAPIDVNRRALFVGKERKTRDAVWSVRFSFSSFLFEVLPTELIHRVRGRAYQPALESSREEILVGPVEEQEKTEGNR